MTVDDQPQRCDVQLLELARGGDGAAFAELWQRYHRLAWVKAQAAGASSPDDVVQEAYLRIWTAISRGGGASR